MIRRYKPMLAKEADKPFSDKDWIFEVKWDGFRAIAYINKELSLRSRNEKELLQNFPELEELKHLAQNVVVDGEIIVLKEGKIDFQTLLERGKAVPSMKMALAKQTWSASYVIFDILEKDDKSLIDLPLLERKKTLKEAIKESDHILLSDYVEEKGETYYQAVMQKGLEGIMAKKKDSPYEPGVRSNNWLKIKKLRTCDCVIFGYTHGTGARAKTFGALLLGLYDKGEKAVYVGKVGTGFSDKMLTSLMDDLRKLKTEDVPFQANVDERVSWLKPTLVCEVTYQVLTNDGKLRMPRFQRLRTDKLPNDCTTSQLGEGNQLQTYKEKRDFKQTSEPASNVETERQEGDKIFVVQEHHARRLHYDFRLEKDGVLKSWAVPKGIPASPEDKRLAVQVEDHPLDYAKFEGEIPEGNYGAGQVIIWDRGTYQTKVWDEKMIEVILSGKKLKGRYVLVPLKRAGKNNWLMLKGKE